MLKSVFRKQPSSWVELEQDSSRRINLIILFVGIVISLASGVLTFSNSPILKRIKDNVYDIQIKSLPPSQPSPSILIVDIDEQSLTHFGQWPWPRYRIALLLAKLEKWGAASVALDMVFPEQDRTSPTNLKQAIERDLQVSLSLSGVPESLRDNDKILADVMRGSSFVLGSFFDFNDARKDSDCLMSATSVALLSKGVQSHFRSKLLVAEGAVCNIKVLAETAAIGFYNARPDGDGVFRKAPLLISYKEKIYPALALEAILLAMGKKQVLVEQTENNFNLRLQEKPTHLDHSGYFYLRFRGPGHSYPYISAKSILDDSVERNQFKDKIVFIGSSAVGLHDIKSTPLDPVMPGVEVHAVIADNILQGDYLQHPYWGNFVEAVTAIFAGMFVYLIMMRAKPLVGLFVMIGGCVLLGFGAQMLLANKGLILSPVPAILTMIVNIVVLATLKFWRERFLYSRRTKQYQQSQEATIGGFCSLAECRDPETGGHLERTQHYIKVLAAHMAGTDKYAATLNEAIIDVFFKAAPLHDIGKIGVPDNILLKPGKLTEQEFGVMKQHTEHGAKVLNGVEKKVGYTPFLQISREIAHYHQEKWDGSGYPEGLAGNDIPLGARLMAVGDVYDALISERVYKKAYSHEMARAIILEGRGSHFDPDVVDAFLATEDVFLQIALKFADTDSQRQALLVKEDG